jgi:hypothetical protein
MATRNGTSTAGTDTTGTTTIVIATTITIEATHRGGMNASCRSSFPNYVSQLSL